MVQLILALCKLTLKAKSAEIVKIRSIGAFGTFLSTHVLFLRVSSSFFGKQKIGLSPIALTGKDQVEESAV